MNAAAGDFNRVFPWKVNGVLEKVGLKSEPPILAVVIIPDNDSRVSGENFSAEVTLTGNNDELTKVSPVLGELAEAVGDALREFVYSFVNNASVINAKVVAGKRVKEWQYKPMFMRK